MPSKQVRTSFFNGGFLMLLSLLLANPAFSQKTFKKNVDLKSLRTLKAEFQVNAGTLKVVTQGVAQVNATVIYSRDAWKPELKFDRKNDQGVLLLKQPEEKNTNMKDGERNEWTISFPQSVPTDLHFRMGAGEGNINLSGAKIKSLDLAAGAGDFKVNLASTSVATLKVSAGVGALTLNLGGARTTNLKADIAGGIGDLTLILPRKTGVRVKISGLGGIETAGLKKQGSYYVNNAYGNTPQTLDITVSAGLGSIKMQEEK